MVDQDGNLEKIGQDGGGSAGSASNNGLAAWLMEIGRETAPLMNDGRTAKELMDELYDDETGLPK